MIKDLNFIIEAIEWTQLQGYTQKHAGNWVDEQNNTIARDTKQLVETFAALQETRKQPAQPVSRKRKYSSKHPNLYIQYTYAKCHVDKTCFCCQNTIPAKTMRYWKPAYTICESCFNEWKQTGIKNDLRNFINQIKINQA